MLRKNSTYADSVSEKLKQKEKVGKEVSSEERLWYFKQGCQSLPPRANPGTKSHCVNELLWKWDAGRRCQVYEVKYVRLLGRKEGGHGMM